MSLLKKKASLSSNSNILFIYTVTYTNLW